MNISENPRVIKRSNNNALLTEQIQVKTKQDRLFKNIKIYFNTKNQYTDRHKHNN